MHERAAPLACKVSFRTRHEAVPELRFFLLSSSTIWCIYFIHVKKSVSNTILSSKVTMSGAAAASIEVRHSFRAFSGSKGFLDRRDLKASFSGLFGYRPSNYELTQACSAAGVDDANSVALQDFSKLVTPKILQRDQDHERRQQFKAMDRDCSGFLTLQDLREVLVELRVQLSDQALADAFIEADCDRDGRVTFRDFERLLLCSSAR